MLAWALLGAAALGVGGCVATIREERLAGVPRPAIDAVSEGTAEAVAGAPVVTGTAAGSGADTGATQVEPCRRGRVTVPMVRDVEIVRSFADDAQERNMALAFLLGAGLGLLAYGANQAVCPPGAGGCSLGAVTTAEDAIVGLAAIPLGFIVFNALRVQDGRAVERVEARAGENENEGENESAGESEGDGSTCPTRAMAEPPGMSRSR